MSKLLNRRRCTFHASSGVLLLQWRRSNETEDESCNNGGEGAELHVQPSPVEELWIGLCSGPVKTLWSSTAKRQKRVDVLKEGAAIQENRRGGSKHI